MNIVRALRHIHNCGYLHMDIKPRNVLLRAGTKTNVALIDFGGASRKGRGGRYRGKPRAGYPPYMAPEQFDSPATLDDSADLFQAAGVCVFMLTGMMPIDAPNLDGDAYDSACRTLQMKGLGRHIADVKLRAVLAKALDPKPSKRYRHAQDFIDALRPFGE
jgi:serine/threonine protein kinase